MASLQVGLRFLNYSRITRHSDEGRPGVLVANWLAARAAGHVIQFDGLSPSCGMTLETARPPKPQANLAAQGPELLLINTRLEDFIARIKAGLQHADWHMKRDLVRALGSSRRDYSRLYKGSKVRVLP